jgi:hypothetical protein
LVTGSVSIHFKEHTVFITGLAVFLGLLFIFIKLPRRALLRMLRYDLLIDLGVTLLVLIIQVEKHIKRSLATIKSIG